MNLKDCHNFSDFRKLAQKRLPSPIFHYIDGAADDEVTYARNTSAFDDVDLVPNVLRGVEDVDLSTTIFGKKLDLPFYLSPTALQRLFHYDGERAVGKAAKKFNTMFGVSALATVSVEDAKRAVDIGCTGIMVSNHGGRQLDGSRSPFDQLAEIVDAVGDKLDVICEGGIHRGTHMLKALSLGAKACSGGRLYLYALAAGGQAGVERALEKYKAELVRDMKLMGCTKISDLNRSNLRFRK